MPDELPTLPELKELYARNVNIMGLLRERARSAQNSVEAILVAYDLQAGSYVRALDDPAHRKKFIAYTGEIANVLSELGGNSVLEVGVGEATTLCAVAAQVKPPRCAGFDISWSRVAFGRRHAQQVGVKAELFTGDLFHLPVCDGSFDVVYTAHSIEPNHGREEAALAELARVSRRWIALFEPSFELGSAATRARIEEHGYVRGLPSIAAALGLRIVRHELLRSSLSERNETALLLLEKLVLPPAVAGFLACPFCRRALLPHRGNHFCESCSLIYPVIDGVPCLLPGNGILGSKYLELA